MRANLPFLEFDNEVATNIYQNIEENLRSINAEFDPFVGNSGSFTLSEKIDNEISNFMGECI